MASARSLASLATLFALVACGGGGGGSASSPSPSPSSPSPSPATSSDAVLSLSLAGGAATGIDHLWVTVTGVAMHASASNVYGDGDSGWVVQTLDTPVTVDLAASSMTDGGSVSLLDQSVSATGTYAQLRLLLASSDPASALASSASAAGLQFNDEVQYTDAGGVHVVPLELPNNQAGVRLLSSFSLSDGTTTPIAVEWSADQSLVRRASTGGGADRFTLRDELRLYNQQLLTLSTGTGLTDDSAFDAISGQLDTTNFCTGSDHTGCIHDVVATVTALSSDSLFRAESRSVNVASDGSFMLYPIPSQSLEYDVVISGGNMETMIVHDVVVFPIYLLQLAPTALSTSSAPIVPVLDTAERAVTVGNALAPAGSRVFFGRTVAGSSDSGADVPFAIAAANTDPATGTLLDTVTLPGGPLHYATYDSSVTPPAFSAVTPVEGADAWSVWSQGTLATTTSAMATLAAGATSVSAPAPVAASGFGTGTLTVTLSGTASNGADHAELIVSNDGGVVSVVDVSSQIATHGGSTTINVPSGSSSGAPAAALYGIALRTWVGATEGTSARWVRTSAPVDPSSAGSASVSLALP